MNIYLIRHGESTSDIKNKYDGDYDDRLTESGLQDAKIIAKKLNGSNIEVVFTSPKIRARETSKIISEVLGCKTSIVDDLAEQDIYGAYLELGKNQPEEEYRRLGEILVNRDNVVEGSETYKNFKERVIKCFFDITHQSFENIAIVTHGGSIRCIFREILTLGEFKEIGNGAIIELKKEGSALSVVNMDHAILKQSVLTGIGQDVKN
ncbi:MAG: histidine phosphatase family protein [Candidatus Paceibacterota bacterium]|jgi:probable phosphoglycerate mutase